MLRFFHHHIQCLYFQFLPSASKFMNQKLKWGCYTKPKKKLWVYDVIFFNLQGFENLVGLVIFFYHSVFYKLCVIIICYPFFFWRTKETKCLGSTARGQFTFWQLNQKTRTSSQTAFDFTLSATYWRSLRRECQLGNTCQDIYPRYHAALSLKRYK